MSDHNQANEAEQAVEAGAGNLPGEVPEDEDIDGPGHVVWRRNCLISLENKRSGWILTDFKTLFQIDLAGVCHGSARSDKNY